MDRVYVCTSFDEATQQCTAGAWVAHSQGPLPPLSVEDAEVIGGQIIVFWVICAVLRIMRQELSKGI